MPGSFFGILLAFVSWRRCIRLVPQVFAVEELSDWSKGTKSAADRGWHRQLGSRFHEQHSFLPLGRRITVAPMKRVMGLLLQTAIVLFYLVRKAKTSCRLVLPNCRKVGEGDSKAKLYFIFKKSHPLFLFNPVSSSPFVGGFRFGFCSCSVLPKSLKKGSSLSILRNSSRSLYMSTVVSCPTFRADICVISSFRLLFGNSQIEALQMRLLHERSMRNMLERAMGRASSTLSPGHRHFTAQVFPSWGITVAAVN